MQMPTSVSHSDYFHAFSISFKQSCENLANPKNKKINNEPYIQFTTVILYLNRKTNNLIDTKKAINLER